jgi:hypothetical protein
MSRIFYLLGRRNCSAIAAKRALHYLVVKPLLFLGFFCWFSQIFMTML